VPEPPSPSNPPGSSPPRLGGSWCPPLPAGRATASGRPGRKLTSGPGRARPRRSEPRPATPLRQGLVSAVVNGQAARAAEQAASACRLTSCLPTIPTSARVHRVVSTAGGLCQRSSTLRLRSATAPAAVRRSPSKSGTVRRSAAKLPGYDAGRLVEYAKARVLSGLFRHAVPCLSLSLPPKRARFRWRIRCQGSWWVQARVGRSWRLRRWFVRQPWPMPSAGLGAGVGLPG
jgi:hypothetical protein